MATFTVHAFSYCGTTQQVTSNLEIVQFDTKPDDITSYDAEEVMQMVKEANHYDDGRRKYFESPEDVSAGLLGYNVWFASRRSDPREAGDK